MKTDEQLTQDVIDELEWEPALQAGLVQVQACGGMVTLRGQLPNPAECWIAERAARRVAGVRRLSLRLTVRPPADGPRADSDLAHDARNVLAWLVGTPVTTVQVSVLHGCITLDGRLAWPSQRTEILAAMRLLPGVQGLADAMQLQPGPPPAEPPPPDTRRIEAALRRRIASGPLQVLVQGSGVTLSGQIRSPAERALAHHAAWGTPGVRAVHYRLQLVG